MSLGKKIGSLQGGHDEARDLVTFEFPRQLPRFHRCLEAVGNGVLHFGEYFHEPMPDSLTVIAGFRRKITKHATVSHVVLVKAIPNGVDVGLQPTKGGQRVVAKRLGHCFAAVAHIKVDDRKAEFLL